MKKSLFALCALATVGSMALSCQKAELEPSDSVGAGDQQQDVTTPVEGIKFTAAFEPVGAPAPAADQTNEMSKTTLSGTKVSWLAGDYISFFVDGQGDAGKNGTSISGYDFRKGYRYQASAAGAVVGFEPATATVPTASTYYALCPHVSDAEGNKGLIHVWIPQYQLAVKDNFSLRRNNVEQKVHIAVAKTNDPNTPLIFKNVVSLMKFTVPSSLANQIVRIRVASAMKEVISGDMCIDASKDEPSVGFFGSMFANANVELQGASMQSHVNLYPGEPTSGNDNVTDETFAAGTYTLSLAPGTYYAGFDVEFMTKDGKSYRRSVRKPALKINRNVIYDMGELSLPSNVAISTSGDGITSLPYAFSFFHNEATNEKPKYITYTKLTSTLAGTATGSTLAGKKAELSGVVAVANKAGADNSGATLKINSAYSVAADREDPSSSSYCWVEPMGRDNIHVQSLPVNSQYHSGLSNESGYFYTFPMKVALPNNFNFSFGLTTDSDWMAKSYSVFYTSDENAYWCLAGTVEIPAKRTSGANYYYYSLDVLNNKISIPAGNNLYVKVVPVGTVVVGGSASAGVGNTAGRVAMHSSFVITPIETGSTATPSGDVILWQPFDELTSGAPIYYNGVSYRERLASIANLPGAALANWSAAQKKAKAGTATGEFTGTEVYARPGFAQVSCAPSDVVGAGTLKNYTGALTTPKLGYAGNIKVKFDVMRYLNPAYDRYPDKSVASNDIKSNESFSYWVGVIGGGKIKTATANGVAGSCEIDKVDNSYTTAYPNHTSWIKYAISGFYDKWCPMELTIEGATADTQIVFLGHPSSNNATNWFTRHFIDNILVTKN